MSLSSEQILALRPAVHRPLSGPLPLGVISELEPTDLDGGKAQVTTVLLRGSECTFRCLMCDLWKYTHIGPTPFGNIPAQIEAALSGRSASNTSQFPSASDASQGRSVNDAGQPQRWIKLYNAANFFAPVNVPTADLPHIASLVRSFDRVIVENHPRLLTPQIVRFAELLDGKLEVAMGLETIEPTVLASLNKQVTVEQVQFATEWLIERHIDVRLFVLLSPPSLDEPAALNWCHASIEACRGWGVRHVSICPVRAGNGAIEHLQAIGEFRPPRVSALEAVLEMTVAKSPMIVTADLWEWEMMRGTCSQCGPSRKLRLETINIEQKIGPPVACTCSN